MKDRIAWKAPRPKRVDELLAPGRSRLDRLLKTARLIERLDRQVRDALNPALAPHVRVANFRDGTLVLVTPVAAIAARLRMESQRILDLVAEAVGKDLHSIEILVAPFPMQQPESTERHGSN